MNNKITNPKTEVPKGMALNDKVKNKSYIRQFYKLNL